MKERKREKQRRWTPVWVACLLLIGVAAWTSTLLPQPDEKTEREAGVEQQTAPYLGIWEGKLARFNGVNPEPEEIYDVSVSSLPKEEQERLKYGVTWGDDETLAMLIDGYTS